MRKLSVMIFTVLCIACFAIFPALANGWGVVTGIAYTYFSSTNQYNEYTAITQSEEQDKLNVVAMKSRYHVQLLVLSADKKNKSTALLTSTTALYQRDYSWYCDLELTLSKDKQLTISYPALSSEEYVFDLSRDDFPLVSATIQNGSTSLQIQAQDQGLQFSNGMEQVTFSQAIALSNFNITLFPKTMEEVKRLNALLNQYTNILPTAQTAAGISNSKQATVSVYSAPSDSSYRAAKGKATLSINDSYEVYGTSGDWTLVEYAVSLRTSRIGYAKTSALKGATFQTLNFSNETVTLQSDAALTDDPHVSQHTTAELKTGTKVTYLATLLPYHMYVETETDGQTVRGFIPLSAVQTDEELTASLLTPMPTAAPTATPVAEPFPEMEIPTWDFAELDDEVSPIAFATVNTNKVNLRKKPKGDIIDKLDKGTTLYVQDMVVSDKTTWYQVSVAIGKKVYTGYIDSSFVDTIHKQYSRIVDIACSNRHVVLLHDDGTVSAIGDDVRGIVDDGMDEWRDVVSVSASFLTSLGVTKDGHVLNTGFRCIDTTNWTNVLSLSTGIGNDWDFVAGITTGDVLISNSNPVYKIADTLAGKKIKQIDYVSIENIVYLLEDGTIHASNSLFEEWGEENAAVLNGLTNVQQLAVGSTHVAALLGDGTVAAAGTQAAACQVSAWHDIVQIAAGSDYTVGLQKNGNVVFAGLNTYGIKEEVNKWKNIVKVATAKEFVLGLRSDGTVVMAGEYTFEFR